MIVLALETSCDETSWSVLQVSNHQLFIKALTISSQTKLHARWGGVVPELAARRHNEIIIPLLRQTLNQAQLQPPAIDLIAVTAGPGLITALRVGVETARALAATWGKPLLGVNHINGHLVSPFLNKNHWPLANLSSTWPAIALVASGGHTELYLMTKLNRTKLLGKTLDDAAGEAFDKVAKMINLPYPGGPRVAKLASQGNRQAFNFPRPMIKHKNCNFSFAGLKTAVLYTLPKIKKLNHQTKANLCAAFEQAVVDVLVYKTLKAAQEYKARTVIVAGGVSANQHLRNTLTAVISEQLPTTQLLLPDLKFTGDNAAMIALAGAAQVNFKKSPRLINNWKKLQPNANWELWN